MNTKEAIERVRTRFDKWALDNEDLTALQALGLVDAESEDERIRKALVEYFAPPVPFMNVCGIPIQKVRDWLEKQKVIDTDLLRKEIKKRMRICDGAFEKDYDTYDPDAYYEGKAAAYQEILSFIDSLLKEMPDIRVKGCKDCWHNYHCPMPQEGYDFNPDTCKYNSDNK